MIKKIYLIFTITSLGLSFNNIAKDNQILEKEKNIRKNIITLKKELKKIKKSNPNSSKIQKTKDEITQLKKDLKSLTSKKTTSNTFFGHTSHIEARTSMDPMHAQDVYNKRYIDIPKEPTNDPHEQLTGYFRNH